MADSIITRRLLISGHVQGVGFRAFVQHEARELGLSGFVRNRNDGTVEALICGEQAKIYALMELCRKGPPNSSVECIETIEELSPQGINDFVIMATI